MRAILTCAASACLLATAALADDSVLASRFGNTTVATDASGAQSKLYYNADHTFTAKAGTMSVKGTWKVDGDKVCLSYDPAPPGMASPNCLPVAAHNVGDTWTVGDGAQKRTVTLVKGIQ